MACDTSEGSFVCNCVQLFSAREQTQLDVYGLWAVLRNQLATDDSFVFNKALSRIKDSISHLPEATLDDDDTLTKLQVLQSATCCRYFV